MNTDQTTFQLWLWGLVWTLGPWLALGFAAVLATIVIQKVSRAARHIEKKPIEQGVGGFFDVVRNSWLHGSLTKSVIIVVIACVMLGGFVAAGMQGFVHRNIQETAQTYAERELANLPDTPPSADENGALHLILLLAMMMACVTVMLSVTAYRRVRRHAAMLAARSAARGTTKPFVVKMFYEKKGTGIAMFVVGSWFLWGFLCQLVGLAVYMFPALHSLPSIPGVETAAIIFLLILSIAMLVALFAPFVWLSVRNFKLQLRHFRENRMARRLFYAQAVVFAGLIGGLLNLYLIDILGNLLWPDVFAR